jgi:HEAT repeat protein
MGGEKGVMALIQAVLSPNPNTKMGGALYLGMVSDPNAMPILLKIITDKTLPVPVRTMVTYSVGSMKKREALSPLISLLKEASKELQLAAAYAIGNLGFSDVDASAALLDKCQDRQWDIRHAATVALGQIKDPRALEYIKHLLKEEKESSSRVELIRALGDLGGEEAITILTVLRESPIDKCLSEEIQKAIDKSGK